VAVNPRRADQGAPVREVQDDPERPWWTPGVYRVAPGVLRVPLPIPEDGLRAVNAYVLDDARPLTVLDPGPGVEVVDTTLRAALAAIDATPGDLGRALVTHVHYDHYTHAVALRRATPTTQVWLGDHERPSLDLLRRDASPLVVQERQLRRYGDATTADRIAGRRPGGRIDDLLRELPDAWIADAQDVEVAPDRRLTARHTPGHTRGHVVFHDRDRRLLFAGDHVLPTITPSIGFEAAPGTRPLASYLGALHAVRAADDARLLPAHGPVTASVHARVDALLDHHATRLEAARVAVVGGASTGVEVAERLRWTRRERHLDELDLFNRMLAVLETGYHLDLLVERGALATTDDGEVARYLDV
jgi:glyoxylase-like metal-dependent hydrolase (beta-lactamase superfamily II)